ncbi:MAG: TrkH family potassium uptake protein [Erysipelotrichaceae bacterium]|nr:TrkH family potassium uptake protein [Erysipelotrichaceae bacterium]
MIKRNHIKQGKRRTPARKIAMSFFMVIVVGTLLLMLPAAHRNQQAYPFVDALFTATSATCVTGLVIDVTLTEFTLFGQVVIMTLIQIGGLGLMTIVAVCILFFKSKLTMHEKITMKEMLNQDGAFNMKQFLMDILKYTFLFESIGALLLAIRFLPKYGFALGMFKSLFIAVSAFCNAGFDILGNNSLMDVAHDPLIMLTIICLIVLGGLGFAVWFDLRDKLKIMFKKHSSKRKFWKSLNFHTRIVLTVTAFLIFFGTLLIFLLERNNPSTLQNKSLPQQLLVSLFEAVTLRTAGFASVDYGALTLATKYMMVLIMFIGGSPGGTAGGIKTTTAVILLMYIISNVKGKAQTVMMKRTISKELIIRAMGIFFINLLTLLLGIFLLCIFEVQDFISIVFEATSALATVGLTLGITGALTTVGKLVIIFLMFVGRIGITTLFLSLISQHSTVDHSATYPNGSIIVG